MIFSKSRPVKIVLVGTGGTGGYIVPQLYRLLYALDRPIRVILCDGDLVEEKNLGRQNFIEADLGKNKAMVLAERYSNAFGIETSYIPQYVEDEEMLEELLEPLQYPQNRYVTNQNGEAVREVISEIVILIGAVDNNRSRQVFHSVFQRAKELIYIDSGNSKASGQVICGVRRSGKTFYQPVASLYPEVLEQTDKFPTELSCAEASISAPQTIAANLAAATVVTIHIYNILAEGNIWSGASFFRIRRSICWTHAAELGTRCCAWPSDMTAGATVSSWMRKGPDWPSKSCSGLPMGIFSAPMWETDHFMQYSLTRHISQSHLAAG